MDNNGRVLRKCVEGLKDESREAVSQWSVFWRFVE